MIYNSEFVLNLEDEKLFKQISLSKYSGYRLGDIVLNYPCSRDTFNKQLFLPQKQKFPDSIAIKYTKLYKGKKSLALKISDGDNLDENAIILKNLCDELNIKKQDDDSLIATIRLGDMIEDNKEKINGIELAKLGGTFWTPVGGFRHILSAKEIINEAKKKNLNRIILVGSKAIGTGMKSVKYLKEMISIIVKEGYECKWFCSYSPDEDLAFISNYKNSIVGPGGFCLVANVISNFRFNKDEKILPIKGWLNFFHLKI